MTFNIKSSPLVNDIAEICAIKSLKIATAESCTGGGVAFELTSLPGSSRWFERGFITYSNLSKIQMLGVQKDSIEKYGAVSEEVVKQMAQGALNVSAADYAIAITGIAGPEGGSLQKPVGSCWFGWSSATLTQCEYKIFAGDRGQIRSQAIQFSLEKILSLIKNT